MMFTSTKMETSFRTKYILNINLEDIPTRPCGNQKLMVYLG